MNAPEMISPPLITAENVDLSNCDREQIQFVGAIQPHGALLVVQEPELRIIQVSANTKEILGLA
jgi:two-component system, chemotaxis family, sensor kinase Cph1